MATTRHTYGWRTRRGVALALALLVPGVAQAVRLVGASFADGILYDVDSETGAASNPRPILAYPCDTFCGDVSVAVGYVAGIEIVPGTGELFEVLTTVSNPEFPNSRFVGAIADPFVGFESIQPLGAQIAEGDLARDPASGDLFAVGLTDQNPPYRLLRIDVFGSVTDVGQIGISDVSGLAFDASGTLFALDTGSDRLLTLDPSDASTLSSVDLSLSLGGVAGMDFDPATGVLWVADGGEINPGRDALFTLDPATGVLTEVGPLGLEFGLSALAVPEPGAAPLALVALGAALGLARLR